MTTERYKLLRHSGYWLIYDRVAQTNIRECRIDGPVTYDDLKQECEELNAEWQKEIKGL